MIWVCCKCTPPHIVTWAFSFYLNDNLNYIDQLNVKKSSYYFLILLIYLGLLFLRRMITLPQTESDSD
jgi:hypothetical protein